MAHPFGWSRSSVKSGVAPWAEGVRQRMSQGLACSCWVRVSRTFCAIAVAIGSFAAKPSTCSMARRTLSTAAG